MTRSVVTFIAICVLLSTPSIYFQVRMSEGFLFAGVDTNSFKPAIHFIKYLIFGLVPPAIILTFARLEKYRISATFFSALTYGVFILFLTNYYLYFGSVPHWQQLANISYLGNAGEQIASQLWGTDDTLIVFCIFAGTFLALFGQKKAPPKKSPNRVHLRPITLAVPAVLLFGIQCFRHPPIKTVDAFGYTVGCSRYGILPTYGLMLRDFFPGDNRAVSLPESRTLPPDSEKFGSARGANVLCIQVESLDPSLIKRKLPDGTFVMPFLHRIACDSAFFPECTAMHAGGGSSDAELAALLSLVPLTSGSGFTRADWDQISPLSEKLNAAGYTCVAMHANHGSFFDRNHRYQKMGFAEFRDQTRFTGEASGWYSRDETFFQQAVKHLKTIPRPFFSYFITMQSHGPFRNYHPETRESLARKLDGLSQLEADYLCTFREVDAAFESLFADLEKAGLLDSTLILIFGDHESGIPKTNRHAVGERIPLIAVHPSLSPGETDTTLVSQIDIAPTITDLLGIPGDPAWLGQSVFSDAANKSTVVLPNGLTITGNNTPATFDEDGFLRVDYSRALLGD